MLLVLHPFMIEALLFDDAFLLNDTIDGMDEAGDLVR